MTTEFHLSKIDAAVDQLDWSIRLFLDHQAYVPAITLAGAAEEIIGGILSQSSFSLLNMKLSTEFGLPPKIVSQLHLNKAKNWLKHWNGLRNEEKIALELETEAIQYIVRAMVNLVEHDQSFPNEGPRFFEWLSNNRADLMEGIS